MSDSSSTALDPKRPWLTDERQLPRHMNWVQTLFNPLGASPKLHFTRAWTLLFMLQLMIIVGPWTIAAVLNAAGGEGKPVGMFGVYATPIVFIATTLLSYVIHSRRLLDAGKIQLLAVVPLIPLIIAVVAFMGAASQQSAQYDERFEMRQDYLANPDAFRAKQREKAEKAKQEAEAKAAEAEASGEEGAESQPTQQGQGRSGPGAPSIQTLDQPMGPKAETVLKNALPTIQMIMIPLSALVAIWSLMWVARAPIHMPKLVYPRDGLVFALTSFHGRLSRKWFWVGVVGLAIVGGLFAGIGMGLSAISPVFMVIPLLVIVAQVAMSAALYTKRLHDMGHTGWLQLVPFVAMFGVLLLELLLIMGFGGFSSPPSWIFAVHVFAALVVGVTTLVFFLWVGLQPNDPEDNEYGPAPDVIPWEPEGAYA
ncbi:DUF805 domain-containing protein [Henriciella sp.]|uniref:DUF805 domain-containing protein n=1 Tax=Henriciella sp. TaxID=1968823 RepID=UPI00260C5FB5|nr:DUF805 domain-containing protein [Henriciella sp.]